MSAPKSAQTDRMMERYEWLLAAARSWVPNERGQDEMRDECASYIQRHTYAHLQRDKSVCISEDRGGSVSLEPECVDAFLDYLVSIEHPALQGRGWLAGEKVHPPERSDT